MNYTRSIYREYILCKLFIWEVLLLSSDRVPKLIKFPADLVVRIEQYREKHGITTFAQTIYILIRKGLDSE